MATLELDKYTLLTYISDLGYEWDEAKNQKNQLKHGIDFLDAVQIFRDPNRLEAVDQRKKYGEIRYQTIGTVEDVELYVVYTNRGKNRRLISARRARRDEREAYHSEKAKQLA